MAISEAARSDLYTGLSEVIGPERAETLMSAIPLHDLDEVATKRDLETATATLRAEIADLRAELKTEIADLRTELLGNTAGVKGELIGEIAALRASMTNWMLTILVTIVAAMVGISFLP